MNDRAPPNEEAKKTTVQVRQCLLNATEYLIENKWSDAKEELTTATVLIDHILAIERVWASDAGA
jgi:hypothetical protein